MPEDINMKTETEKKKISSLLALKTAPKGKIEGDFRVALYAVAAPLPFNLAL